MNNYKIIGGDGRQYGPVSATELRKWIAEQRLNATSQVQLEGTTDWVALGTVTEFADAFGGAQPPPISTPFNPELWTRQVLDRPAELRFGECLSSGFSFLVANPGFVIGSVTLAWLVRLIMSLVPLIGGILHLVFAGVVTGGLYLACLRRMRGEKVGITNLFDGFKVAFVPLMLVGAISSLLKGIGFIFCLLPGLYLLVAWSFALPLAAEKRLEFWSAMELSRKVSTRVWFPLFFLLLLVFLPFLVAQTFTGINVAGYVIGTLREVDFDMQRWLNQLSEHAGALFKLSLLWGLIGQAAGLLSQFIAVGALMRAYENLFGERKP